MNETAKTDWSVILRKAAWISLGIALVLFFLNSFFTPIFEHLAINIGGTDFNLVGTFLWIFVVGLLALLIADLVSPIRPFDRANSRFWIGRVFFDLLLVFIPGAYLTAMLLAPVIRDMNDFLSFQVALTTAANGGNMFLLTLASGGAFVLVLLVRFIFHSLPPGLFKLKITNLWRDLLFVLLVSAGILAFNFAHDFVLSHLGINAPDQFTFDKKALDNYGIPLILLGGGILVPICEELFFRGYLLSLLSTKGKWFGIIASSLLFAAIHFYFVGFLALFVAGLLLAISYQKRQNLLVPIGIHIINNFVALGLLIIQTRGGL